MMMQSQPSFLRKVLDYSLPLIFGVLAALVFANVAPGAYEGLVHWSPVGHDHPLAHYLNLHFLVNDIFMALFFGLAAKEIVEAALPGGALNPVKKAINPLLGTIGGVLGPVGVYFAYVFLSGNHEIARGWGIPTATDIALAWLVARVVFGSGHPAVSFLLLLAVADDAIGLGIIAIFYPDPAHPVEPAYLLVVAAAMAMAFGLRRIGVESFWPYVFVPGVVSWTGLFLAHLHPALALVAVVPFMPAGDHDAGLYVERHAHGEASLDTLNQFEHFFKIPVDLGLFFFGLANAGVQLGSVGDATWAVLLALIVGKTAGITLMSYLGHRLGFSLPEGMSVGALVAAGLIAALGLTVALFVAGVAFQDPTLQGAAKMGALFSAVAAPLAIVLGRALRVHRAG
jgi:Na+:H+ antiporter, NhaA family